MTKIGLFCPAHIHSQQSKQPFILPLIESGSKERKLFLEIVTFPGSDKAQELAGEVVVELLGA